MDDMTHTVRITIAGNYPHGQKQHAEVSVGGTGSIEHLFDAFKAAIVAAGYSVQTAAKLDHIDI